MGNKQQTHRSNFILGLAGTHMDIHSTNLILEPIPCPFCNKIFDGNTSYKQFNLHLKKCGINFIEINKVCELYPTSLDIKLNELVFRNYKNYHVNLNVKKDMNFDKKVEELKIAIKSRKISWQDGFCQLDLNRQDFLKESMKQIDKVDLYKELKINFIGEVSYDAGGIMREWFTTIFQALEGEKLKLFIQSDTNDFSYSINPFLVDCPDNLIYFRFIGKLIAKALLDNITINVCFNKLIYKMLLEEKIEFNDLVFIDSPLYNSLSNLKEIIVSNKANNNLGEDKNKEMIEELGLYYSIEIKDIYNHMHSFELVKDGKNIPVVDIEDYISKRINFLIGLYEPFIKELRETLYKFIPKDKINVFTSDELELVINGRPFIDVEEWREFTEYKTPYNKDHKIIKWYWEILNELDQKQLSNLLLFCTGSARVPLGGFAALESNRGNIAKFTIEEIPYINKTQNFIKAHTCFNRLDIPQFKTKQEMKQAIDFVSNNEIIGFGID